MGAPSILVLAYYEMNKLIMNITNNIYDIIYNTQYNIM